MKKIRYMILLMLSTVLTVTGCEKKQNGGEWSNRIPEEAFQMTEEGCYWENDSQLSFFDFAQKQSVVLCSNPGCTHEDDSCPANTGMVRNFYSGGYLYWVDSIRDWQKEVLYRRDRDNSSEVRVATLLEGEIKKGNSYAIRQIVYNEHYMYYSATIYTPQDERYSEDIPLHSYCGIWRMDLTTGEETVVIPPAYQHISPTAVKDDSLIFLELKFPVDVLSSTESERLDSREFQEETKWTYKMWDEKTGEIRELFNTNYYNPAAIYMVKENTAYVFQANKEKTEETLRLFDLETRSFASKEKIFPYRSLKRLNDGYVAMCNDPDNGDDICLYNYLTDETVDLKGKADRYIEAVTPDGFIFYKQEEDGLTWIYVEKEDAIAGNDVYIRMDGMEK